jgi:hypothetical protein
MVYKKYHWSKGSRIKSDAAMVGVELEQVREKNKGKLTAEDVVRKARAKKSAMHSEFTWDDSAAADEFRKAQARNIINHLRVEIVSVVVEGQEEKNVIHAYVNVAAPDRHYIPTDVAIESADVWEQVIIRARGRVAAAVQDLKSMNEYAETVALLESALCKIDEVIKAPKKKVDLKKMVVATA